MEPSSRGPATPTTNAEPDASMADDVMAGLVPESSNPQRDRAIRERETRRLQRHNLRLMGRPYWTREFVITWGTSVVLGGLLGLGSFLLLESASLLNRWWNHNHNKVVLALRLVLGGFLSGICLWSLPCSPQRIRHFYHDLIDLDPKQQSISHRLCTLVAGWILLLVGAPLGPELVLGALATLLVSLACSVKWLSRRRRRRVASWMQAVVAGALACSFPSFLGSLAALQELVATARPHDATIDAALQRQRQRSNHNNREQEEDETDSDDSQQEDDQQIPLLSAYYQYGWSSPADFLNRQPHLSSLDNNVLELLLLAATVAMSSAATQQALSGWIDPHHSTPWRDFETVLQPHHETSAIHYLLAPLLGLLGGVVGWAIVGLTALLAWLRSKTTKWIQSATSERLSGYGPVLVSSLAGIVAVLLAFLPLPEAWMVTDNGIRLSLHLLQHQSTVPMLQLWLTATCRVVTLAIVLGLGGWFGGPIFPLASIGLLVGLILSKTLGCSLLPVSLTVPCVMVAVVGSIVPCPLAMVISLLQLFGLGVAHGGPLLVAVVVAHGVTGGSGLVRKWGQGRMGVRYDYTSEDEAEEEMADQLMSVPSDDDILRNVRSAIFGGLSQGLV